MRELGRDGLACLARLLMCCRAGLKEKWAERKRRKKEKERSFLLFEKNQSNKLKHKFELKQQKQCTSMNVTMNSHDSSIYYEKDLIAQENLNATLESLDTCI